MYTLVKEGNISSANTHKFICDTLDDLNDLLDAPHGSIAKIADNSRTYIMGDNGWQLWTQDDSGVVKNCVEKCDEAVEKTVEAIKTTEKIDIDVEQTQTGADVTITNRKGQTKSVHIDTMFAINTWKDVQNAVRLGLGPKLFPVGYEFTIHDSDMDQDTTWIVVAHDHHKAANKRLNHTMTLHSKYLWSNKAGNAYILDYDSREALYYAENGLAPGTYYYTIKNCYMDRENDKNYQFTLANPVPVGGQIVVDVDQNYYGSGRPVYTYASNASIDPIEVSSILEGENGVYLGETDGSKNLNYYMRVYIGSNNYAQSAIRQWLNSAGEAGTFWKPTNKFDRPPIWNLTQNGLLHGLPTEFIEVIEPAIVPCRTNNHYELESLDGTVFTPKQTYSLEDKIFLLSQPEVYGTYYNEDLKDGELLEYYKGTTNAEKIKYDLEGNSMHCIFRTPYNYYSDTGIRNTVVIASIYSKATWGGGYLEARQINTQDSGLLPTCIIA